MERVLRDVRDDDIPIFFEQQNDPEAIEMAAFPPREWEPFVECDALILPLRVVTATAHAT